MARYVRLEDGNPVEFRNMAEPPPAHKASLWVPVIEQASPSHAAGETIVSSESLVNGTWVISHDVVALPVETLVAKIKNEAQQRIVELTGATSLDACLIKQLNALMRATELTNKRAQGQTLTAGEETEAARLEGLASAIKSIRAKSNVLEADPPVDFTSDIHWKF